MSNKGLKIAVAVLALALIGSIVNYEIIKPEKEPPLDLEPALGESVINDNKDAALAYLQAVIEKAAKEGSDATLKKILSMAKDDKGEPICQKIAVGENENNKAELVNIACVQSSPPTDQSNQSNQPSQ